MTTPINTFQDILDAIERDPALRDELRRHILGDELLQLPAQFRVFLEAVADMREILNRMEKDVGTLKTDVEGLKEGQQALRDDVSVLKTDVEGLKTDVEGLKTDVEGLKEGQQALRDDVSVLKTDVEGLKTDVEGLKEGQQALRDDVSVLKTDVEGLKTDVEGLKEGQQALRDDVSVLKTDVARIGGDVSRLAGTDYEAYASRLARRRISSVMGISRAQIFSTARNPEPLRILADEALETGALDERRANDLERADIVLTANQPDDTAIYILGEISMTAQEDDVEKAKRRAAILSTATGVTCMPVVLTQQVADGVTTDQVSLLIIEPEQQPL